MAPQDNKGETVDSRSLFFSAEELLEMVAQFRDNKSNAQLGSSTAGNQDQQPIVAREPASFRPTSTPWPDPPKQDASQLTIQVWNNIVDKFDQLSPQMTIADKIEWAKYLHDMRAHPLLAKHNPSESFARIHILEAQYGRDRILASQTTLKELMDNHGWNYREEPMPSSEIREAARGLLASRGYQIPSEVLMEVSWPENRAGNADIVSAATDSTASEQAPLSDGKRPYSEAGDESGSQNAKKQRTEEVQTGIAIRDDDTQDNTQEPNTPGSSTPGEAQLKTTSQAVVGTQAGHESLTAAMVAVTEAIKSAGEAQTAAIGHRTKTILGALEALPKTAAVEAQTAALIEAQTAHSAAMLGALDKISKQMAEIHAVLKDRASSSRYPSQDPMHEDWRNTVKRESSAPGYLGQQTLPRAGSLPSLLNQGHTFGGIPPVPTFPVRNPGQMDQHTGAYRHPTPTHQSSHLLRQSTALQFVQQPGQDRQPGPHQRAAYPQHPEQYQQPERNREQ
ncbi:uncharacterized protein F5Z01DRAFT_633874 [Emericellopsis atlantica]|uniref:Uncharacterized protein n=1 Tax=Emericellopsis atlantica TaxID=2614577 RepID=A0A9P7ZT07_9HYPO|nr:uncharacterized protein F5Z01DRAFT_633874 [Emericellopsis atlantica]KAG9257103.1 hypothetical protein F5Z01DRAFT_633874 [Emericellopsis atlantica]